MGPRTWCFRVGGKRNEIPTRIGKEGAGSITASAPSTTKDTSESDMTRPQSPEVTSHASRAGQSGRRIRPDEDRMMLDLAVEWLPFGGPNDDDIWVRFGIGPMQFWHRLCYLLTLPKMLRLLDAAVVSALKAQAMTQFNPPRRAPTSSIRSAGNTCPVSAKPDIPPMLLKSR